MSLSHIIIFGIILIIVIPPEKLPEVMRNVGRFLNDLRRTTSGVWDDIKTEAQLKPEDLLKYQEPNKNSTEVHAAKQNVKSELNDELDNTYKPKSNQTQVAQTQVAQTQVAQTQEAQTQEVKSNESKS